VQDSSRYMLYDPYPCDGDDPQASGSDAYGLLQPCILGTLVDAMRTTLVVLWAGDCARQSVIVSPVLVCSWQRVRPPSLLTQKVAKNRPPTMAIWAHSGCAFRIRLESAP